jgi:hypothetical protein
VEEAIAAGEAAIAIEPAHRASRVNLALSYLLAGDYERGLREYEWRPFERGVEGLPRWDGAALDGKRLLVARDQGLGDFIALSRFFEPLRARAGALLGV